MLIIIQGASGTGKTTLSRKLSKDLNIGVLSKDDIKELLFDSLGLPEDVNRSGTYGRASMRAFYEIVDEWLSADANRHLILESAFTTDFANDTIRKMYEKYNIPMLQIYVKVNADIRKMRLQERNLNGLRHAGHLEKKRRELYEESFVKKYQPLAIKRTIEVDTSDFDNHEYTILLNKIKKEIE